MTADRLLRAALRLSTRPIRKHLAIPLPVTVAGRRFRVPSLHGIETRIPREGSWKLEAIRRLLPLKEGAFVDCGVNLGQTLLELRVVSDRPYLGFEPNPDCVYYVRRMIHLNDWRDCTLIGAGLSDAPGHGVLRLGLDGGATDPAGTLREERRPNRPNRPVATVPVLPLDDLWPADNPPASLVKIDVEGFEAKVLRGMQGLLASHRPTILCEVFPASPVAEDLSAARARYDEILAVLATHDYALLRLLRTPDTDRLVDAEVLDDFPMERWERAHAHRYDYVFAPHERVRSVLAALPGTHAVPERATA